jgi:hypothetical protein
LAVIAGSSRAATFRNRWGSSLSSKFNWHGYLEPGLHALSILEIEAHFVASFPHSATRKNILIGYKQYSNDVVALVGNCEQYLSSMMCSSRPRVAQGGVGKSSGLSFGSMR